MIEKKISKNNSKIAILVLILAVGLLVLGALIIGDRVYLTLNDNLDSNIPEFKMARDYGAFGNSGTEVPFLGGNSRLRMNFTLYTLPYYVFPPLFAYYFSFIVKVFLSGLGFFLLARAANKYSGFELNPTVFCLCGLTYGLLGAWPSASIEFSLLPWWILVFYMLYKTRRLIFMILPVVFVWGISFPLMGIFALFYTGAIWFLLCIHDRKFHLRFLAGFAVLSVVFFALNRGQISTGMSGSSETIKSLSVVTYADSIKQSLSMFFGRFLFERQYHSGGADLRFFVIPVGTLFFVIHLIRLIRKKEGNNKTISKIYVVLFLMIIVNTLACCFDNNYWFRRIISFASGFSFSRFAWLSPCMWMILFALVCSEVEYTVLRYGSVLVAFLMIVFCPGYKPLNTMFNELYYNVSVAFGDHSFPEGNMVWTWKDYYSEDLFERIKKDISYNGEWAAAYGLDCAVLQFNGIKTLDGYYSGYSLEYHDTFEKLIRSELEIDEHHREYWNNSHGVRAYLYSPKWDFIMLRDSDVKEDHLYMDSEVFLKELGGRYIFSRVIISNADRLGLMFEGKWSDEESPYTIYVYSITEKSLANAKAGEAPGSRQWEIALPYVRDYGAVDLLHNETVSTESDYMILDKGGVVFGPADPIEEGIYSISFCGRDLDVCTCDAFANSNWYAVQYSEEYRSSSEIRLKLHILEPVPDIEFRVFNNSNNRVCLQRIIVEKTDAVSEWTGGSIVGREFSEISPELVDGYRMSNGRQNDILGGIDDVKILILERKPAEMSFNGFDSKDGVGYAGTPTGNETVRVCQSAMEKLADQYRADSIDDATVLVIIESEYYLSGYLMGDTVELKEGGEQYTSSYFPKYDLISYLNIYNVKTGFYETRGYKRTAAPMLISDAESAYIWSIMTKLDSLNTLLLKDDGADYSGEIDSILGELDRNQSFLHEHIKFWKDCILKSDVSISISSIEDVYWQLAELLKKANKDTVYATQYEIALADKDRDALKAIVRSMGGFGLEDLEKCFPGEEFLSDFSIEKDTSASGGQYWVIQGTSQINSVISEEPEIALLWERIEVLNAISTSLTDKGGDIDVEAIREAIRKVRALDGEIEEKRLLWDKCLELKQYNVLLDSVREQMWNYAEKIKAIDENDSHKAAIQEAIDSHSFEGLAELVDVYGYTRADLSVERVKEEKMYLAKTDSEWVNEVLSRFADSFVEKTADAD